MDTSYCGIITALATPFDGDGRINETALCELIERNIEMGVSGFFVADSKTDLDAYKLHNVYNKLKKANVQYMSFFMTILCRFV
ncbi:MAG: dihydrodipicolinate synthase family protein [Clostridia bacterium]|nr:dihydrodipicolinate synthase family protein [Clostridia bacterium]